MNKAQQLLSKCTCDTSAKAPKLMLITPDIAAKLLEETTPPWQRDEKAQTYSKYVRDMQNGDWVAGAPDMLVWTKDGWNANGRHRLTAVVKSDTAQWFWVLDESEQSMYAVIDNGRCRDWKDYVNKNINDRSIILAIAPAYMSMKEKNPVSRILRGERERNRPFSRAEKLHGVEKYMGKLAMFAERGASCKIGTENRYANHYALAFAFIDECCDSSMVSRFYADLSSYLPANNIIDILRKHMLTYANAQSKKDQKQYNVRAIVAAYQIYLEGRENDDVSSLLNHFTKLKSTILEDCVKHLQGADAIIAQHDLQGGVIS